MLNHFSIIGSMFGLVLLAVAMVRNSRELITVSFACLASVAIISIPVYFTGPPAEEAIKHLTGISEEVVERHGEAAQFAFTAIECVGALALAGLWLFRIEPPPRWFLVILLVGSLLTAGVMIYTANRGRRIRHPEIAFDSGGLKHSVDSTRHLHGCMLSRRALGTEPASVVLCSLSQECAPTGPTPLALCLSAHETPADIIHRSSTRRRAAAVGHHVFR